MTAPPVKLSAAGTLTKMKAQFGKSWPNPWWPTGNSKYNDCAAAVSWALFGLKGDQPYYTVVSQLLAGIGGVHMGNAGLKAGDVIGFDWGYGNNYDHTEVCVSVNRTAGTVTSRGTNSNPGDDMRDRTRSLKYVKSYARPDYSGVSNDNEGEGENMFIVFHDPPGINQAKYLASEFHTNLVQAGGFADAGLPEVKVVDVDRNDWTARVHAPLVEKNLAAIAKAVVAALPDTGGETPGPEPTPPPSFDLIAKVVFDAEGAGAITGTLEPQSS